ncbi:MAG: hypothetical protein D6791_15680 [Chloroflexi bacterium]|nr:MAG: hypothetical protein D6791_15680 [Chloroflexota bacterium]
MSQPHHVAPVLIVWKNPLFLETVQAVLAQGGVPAVAARADELGNTPASGAGNYIIAEGDRDTGRRLLMKWLDREEVHILAFSMADEQAHLFCYQRWSEVSRESIFRSFLDLDSDPIHRMRNPES